MAFNLEDVLPKGWIVKETYIPHLDATVRTYRHPNPDPVVREKKLQELGQIMLPAWYRKLEAEEKAKAEAGAS